MVVSRIAVTVLYSTHELFVPEVYPRRIRGLGSGLNAIFSSIFVTLSYFLILNIEKVGLNSNFLVAGCCLMGIVVSRFIP